MRKIIVWAACLGALPSASGCALESCCKPGEASRAKERAALIAKLQDLDANEGYSLNIYRVPTVSQEFKSFPTVGPGPTGVIAMGGGNGPIVNGGFNTGPLASGYVPWSGELPQVDTRRAAAPPPTGPCTSAVPRQAAAAGSQLECTLENLCRSFEEFKRQDADDKRRISDQLNAQRLKPLPAGEALSMPKAADPK